MKILLLALGTRGDFEVMRMLAEIVASRGHEVVLASSPFFEPLTRNSPVRFQSVGEGTQEALRTILHELREEPDKVRRTHRYYRLWLEPQLAKFNQQIGGLVSKSDYFVNNLRLTARNSHGFVPGAIVTYDPPHSVDAMVRHRERMRDTDGAMLELVAFNRLLIDPHKRWPDPFIFTGFWRRTQPSAPPPSSELERFVRLGDPPVILTMGSMVTFDPVLLARQFREALLSLGRRGVIVTSWSGISQSQASCEHVMCVEEVDYQWLFPQACCVVHHGGCGTVEAVLHAGKPSVILPQITSQEHFASILSRERLCAASLDTSRLKPSDLANAVHSALSDQSIHEAVRIWSDRIRSDDGLTHAADALEAHFRRHGPQTKERRT
jgi:UDP:flavonoid glycosyltransferase YjiC (YdhE family)